MYQSGELTRLLLKNIDITANSAIIIRALKDCYSVEEEDFFPDKNKQLTSDQLQSIIGQIVEQRINGHGRRSELQSAAFKSPATTDNYAQRLGEIQQFIDNLGYNHTKVPQYFAICKQKPYNDLMRTGQDIARLRLPIRCLEATMLALHLTNGETPKLHRFSIGFQSQCKGRTYRHIVLGLCYAGKFGALGLSRRDTLAYKEVRFNSLVELLNDYRDAYELVGHLMTRIALSRPITHDPQSNQVINWKHLVIDWQIANPTRIQQSLEEYCSQYLS